MENLKPVKNNGLSLFEIEHNDEFHVFHVAHNEDVVAVGSIANAGFMPQFWIEKDDCFTLDQHLETLYEMLQESLLNDEQLSGRVEI